MKIMCSVKDPLRIKKTSYKWKEIFTSHIVRGTVYKTYKQHSLNIKKENKPIRIWTKEIKRLLTEENKQMANKHMKRHSTSLVTGEMQIKT